MGAGHGKPNKKPAHDPRAGEDLPDDPPSDYKAAADTINPKPPVNNYGAGPGPDTLRNHGAGPGPGDHAHYAGPRTGPIDPVKPPGYTYPAQDNIIAPFAQPEVYTPIPQYYPQPKPAKVPKSKNVSEPVKQPKEISPPKKQEPPHPASIPIPDLCILDVLPTDLVVWILTFVPEVDLLNAEIACTAVQRACNQIFPLLCDAATKSQSFNAMRELVRKPYKETPENEAQSKERYLKQARQAVPCMNCKQIYRQITNTPTSCETPIHPGTLKDDNTYTCCGAPLYVYRTASSFASRVPTPGCTPSIGYHAPNVNAVAERMCLVEAKLELEQLKKPVDASFMDGLKARTESFQQAQEAEDDDNYTENEW